MEENKKPENPPAFPTTGYEYVNQSDVHPTVGLFGGMSLRDYFAAKAMHALLFGGSVYNSSEIAQKSYKFADAMLKTRQE